MHCSKGSNSNTRQNWHATDEQIRPDLSVNEFYNVLIDTAYWSSEWGTRPNNNYGWGEIDDYAAAVYVRDAGAVSGQIMDGSCNTPVPAVDVRVYDNTPGSRARGASPLGGPTVATTSTSRVIAPCSATTTTAAIWSSTTAGGR